MSRNLCQTSCYFCGGVVTIVEAERALSEKDAGCYFPEFVGMIVANAECFDCEAKYLAWVRDIPGRRHRAEPFEDLSFRSTFNDEPGLDDLPRWIVEMRRVRVREATPEDFGR